MAGQPLHFNFRPVIGDQHTGARAYFLSVIAILFLESMIRIVPALTYHLISRRKQTPQRPPKPHLLPTVFFHKLLTQPSPLPILTNHAIATILRCLLFTGLNILFGWKRIRYTTDYQLYGWLTLANGGLALLLPTRTNLFSLVARIPSPILLAYHRWAGVATLDTVLENERIRVGIVAWAALGVMFLTSVRFIRRRAFEVFYYVHFVFVVFVAGAFYHAADAAEFLVPGLALSGLDRAVRAWYSNVRNVEVTGMTHYSAGDVTKLRFEGKMLSPRPGQIVWVQVPGVSWLNWHPFTIIPFVYGESSASKGQTEGGTIAIRALGGYTRKVMGHLLAAKPEPGHHGNCNDTEDYRPNNLGDTNMTSVASSVKIRIDGPYGQGRLQYSNYPVIVLVAGGIGITPAINIATHLVNEAMRARQSRLASPSCPPSINHDHQPRPHQYIHLLWAVKDVTHLSWFEEELSSLVALTQSKNLPLTLDVSLYVTNGGKDSIREEQELGRMTYKYQGPGKVHPGRPNMTGWFQHVRASLRPGLGDVAVNLCGPGPLVRSARKAALQVSDKDVLFMVEQEEFEF
ncbi:ferredoxin reductase [Naviculisporaceae sp. PSN 640]